MEKRLQFIWIFMLLLIRQYTIQKTSKYAGVSYRKARKKWCANIYYDGKQQWVGYFEKEIDAAKAYDKVMAYYNADVHKMNFAIDLAEAPNNIRRRIRVAGKIKRKASSIYLGVHYSDRLHKWKAEISHNKQCIHIGFFNSETEAASAYDKVARYYHGENAVTNFEGHHSAPASFIKLERHPVTSHYRGVCRHKNIWLAQIKVHRKRVWSREYKTEVEAAEGYDRAARYYHGEKAQTNFSGTAILSHVEIRKEKCPSTSSYKGVSYCKRDKRWIAQIKLNGKTKYLGYYKMELEADRKSVV